MEVAKVVFLFKETYFMHNPKPFPFSREPDLWVSIFALQIIQEIRASFPGKTSKALFSTGFVSKAFMGAGAVTVEPSSQPSLFLLSLFLERFLLSPSPVV